ncbi:MAG: 16S rRNA (guanine(527)-N(7))-methyltransferase RsmG [Lachnospiraceae bacterium]|nr:16S rRNA (guanine(527)-N(7))-methyltransferase RsmG [Lachnospiraceae bacterium]
MTNEELLRGAFRAAGVELSDAQVQAFLSYADLLVRRNEEVNLTAITEFPDIAVKHFVDSAALYLRHPELFSDGARFVDVGSGAGFPGIVLKILAPQIELTCLDSLRKRLDFLKELAESLGLQGVSFVHARAEDAGRDPVLRESFDVAVARAVAGMPVLCEYCAPLVRLGGVFAAFKGKDGAAEADQAARAASLLGCGALQTEEYVLAGTDFGRALILAPKTAPTPNKYPRKAGTPGRQPL